MELYRTLYYQLFGKLADAVELLEAGNVWDAKRLLIQAQQEAEAFFIAHEDEET